MAPRNVIATCLVCAGLVAAVGARAADDARAGPARADPRHATASPAVQAAEKARLPGELRPPRPPVPQLVMPLRRDAVRGRPSSRAAGIRAGTDECAARVSSEERRICALLTQSGSRGGQG